MSLLHETFNKLNASSTEGTVEVFNTEERKKLHHAIQALIYEATKHNMSAQTKRLIDELMPEQEFCVSHKVTISKTIKARSREHLDFLLEDISSAVYPEEDERWSYEWDETDHHEGACFTNRH